MLAIDEIYSGTVVKIEKTYALIKVQTITGIVHISEISDYHVKNISDIISIDNTYNFKLIGIKGNNYIFSYKQLYPKLLKIRNKIIPTPSGFKNLYNKTIDLLK